MSNVLFETDLYRVEVGECVDKKYGEGRPVYQIINKQTSVMETETSVLPQAIFYATDFTKAMKALEEDDPVEDANILILEDENDPEPQLN